MSHFSKNRGFTILETLVAIAILLVAVVGPISLIGNSLHSIYYVRDQMLAVNLAQEGIEAVRQVRDSNLLNGSANPLPNQGYYLFKPTATNPLLSCGGCTPSNVPRIVYLDPNSGVYYQQTGVAPADPQTVFKRVIQIANVVNGKEIVATSTVTWTTGGQAGRVDVSEHLFAWKP